MWVLGCERDFDLPCGWRRWLRRHYSCPSSCHRPCRHHCLLKTSLSLSQYHRHLLFNGWINRFTCDKTFVFSCVETILSSMWTGHLSGYGVSGHEKWSPKSVLQIPVCGGGAVWCVCGSVVSVCVCGSVVCVCVAVWWVCVCAHCIVFCFFEVKHVCFKMSSKVTVLAERSIGSQCWPEQLNRKHKWNRPSAEKEDIKERGKERISRVARKLSVVLTEYKEKKEKIKTRSHERVSRKESWRKNAIARYPVEAKVGQEPQKLVQDPKKGSELFFSEADWQLTPWLCLHPSTEQLFRATLCIYFLGCSFWQVICQRKKFMCSPVQTGLNLPPFEIAK